VTLLDQDRFRHLLSDIFVSILSCLNVLDITILYRPYHLRTACKKKGAQPRPEIGHCSYLLKVLEKSPLN